MAARKSTGATAKAARAVRKVSTAKSTPKAAKVSKPLPAAVAVQMIRRAKLGRFVKAPEILNRGGYNPVWGPDQLNRRWTSAETGNALSSLPASERNRLIALARNVARNSVALEACIRQLEQNIVGPKGGQAVFSFPENRQAAGKTIHRAFANWAQTAEYYDDQSLNSLLKLCLRTLLLGGDLALVFDWGVVQDTGKIIAFDPDCIGNISEGEFKAAFGNRYTQHQGILKNRYGQTCGVICSMSQRGQTEFRLFNPDGSRAAWTLVKPAGTSWIDSRFTLIRDLHQINGMRGASSLWSGLGTISDDADLRNYEIQTAKKNSQIFGQVTQSGDTATNEAEIAAAYDPDAIGPEVIGDETDADNPVAEAMEQEHLNLDIVNHASAIVDVMPENTKMEIFDTKRPNTNLVEFSRWLIGGAAWAGGLSKLYSTGESTASYSASMAEMILANQTFQCEWKKLETQCLDWALMQWSRRAQARGEIPQDSELPEDWRRTCVRFMEPQQKALNPVDDANATTIALRNLTTSYHEKLGADWKDKLKQIGEEIAWAKENGIPDPRLQTTSGAIIPTNTNETKEQ